MQTTSSAEVERLIADRPSAAAAAAPREVRAGQRPRASTPSPPSSTRVYAKLARKRRAPRAPSPTTRSPSRDWITIDLHLHTDWSHDCSIPAEDLLDHAEEIGLGGIAVTDHNVFGGALEAVELARDRDLVVIPGEEVKTDNQGEVIGLFLERRSRAA